MVTGSVLRKIFKRLWGSRTGRKVLYLYLVQGVNYVLPLLVLPHLAHTLGPETFAKLALAQVVANYLSFLVDYGFGFSATREVATRRTDAEWLGKLASEVLHARLVLVVPSGFLLFGVFYLFPLLRGEWVYALGALAVVFGYSLNPVWFFQGKEEVKPILFLELGLRISTTLGIFLWVRGPQHGALPLLLQGFVSSGLGALGLFWIFSRVPFSGLRGGTRWLRKGALFSFYNMILVAYSFLPMLLVSFFCPPTAVGQYAFAERIVRGLVNLWNPIGRVFFPKLSFAFAHSYETTRRWLVYGGLATLGLGAVVSLILWIVAPWAMSRFIGPDYRLSTELVQIMSFYLFLSSLTSFLGLQVFFPLGLERLLLTLTLLVVAGFLALGSVAALHFGVVGVAWAVVLGELVLAMGMIVSLAWVARRKRL
ncbi:MAG: oligosaccharide flippase family protein [Thermus sp.]|uniref:oligosaccharide flippase family protein n=1 Tax=Thermus sp. TaxID=275 RepID=UPI00351BB9B3